MKNITLISTILFLSLIVTAQEDTLNIHNTFEKEGKENNIPKDADFSSVSVGFNISSTLESSDGINNGDLKYGLGVLIKMNMIHWNSNFSFITGLSYDILQHHYDYNEEYYNLLLHRKIEDHFSYLNIPASFCFQIGKSRFKPLIDIGLQGSILTDNQYTLDDEIFHATEKMFVNGSFSAFYGFGLGFTYKIKPELDLTFNLNYFHTIIPLQGQSINAFGDIIYEPYSLSYYKASIGVIYHFNK